jgi:hypothetical protein
VLLWYGTPRRAVICVQNNKVSEFQGLGFGI